MNWRMHGLQHSVKQKRNELLYAKFEADIHRISAPKEKTHRLNPIKQKQMEDRCAFLEEEIPRVEASIAHTEEQLGVYVSATETQRLTTLTEDLRSQLAALTTEWEELMAHLENV